jgi:IS30 family transposase
LRQFFPNQTNFKLVQPEALAAVILINKKPKKLLDYKTPWEVIYLDKLGLDKLGTDALQI